MVRANKPGKGGNADPNYVPDPDAPDAPGAAAAAAAYSPPPPGAGLANLDSMFPPPSPKELGVATRQPEAQKLRQRELEQTLEAETRTHEHHGVHLAPLVLSRLRETRASDLARLAKIRMEVFSLGDLCRANGRVKASLGEIQSARIQKRDFLFSHFRRVLEDLNAVGKERFREFHRDIFLETVAHLRKSHAKYTASVVSNHEARVEELRQVLRVMLRRHDTFTKECRMRFFGQREVMSKKFSNAYEVMKIKMSELLKQKKRIHDILVASHNLRVEETTRKHHDLKKDADRVSGELRDKSRLLKVLSDQEQRWKAKLLSNLSEATRRNGQLRAEIENMKKVYSALKMRLCRFRGKKKRALLRIVQLAKTARTDMLESQELAKSILANHRLIQSMETTKERSLWAETVLKLGVPNGSVRPRSRASSPSTYDRELRIAGQAKTFILAQDPSANIHEKNMVQVLSEDKSWETMTQFHENCNRVRLHIVAAERESEELAAVNEALRDKLRRYIRGITVNPDLMDGPNTLMMVQPAIASAPGRMMRRPVTPMRVL